jgi:hypothetical protein
MLEAGLAAAQAVQRTAIDSEPARTRKALDSLVEKLQTIERRETFDAVVRRAKEHEATNTSLNEQRRQLAITPVAGIIDAAADALRTFAVTARNGPDEATPAERREPYEILRLRASVYRDPEGVQIGRRNRFPIEWEARIPLLHSASRFLRRDAI